MSDRRSEVIALGQPSPTFEEARRRLQAARETLGALCQNRRTFRMTIPVEPTDTDIVLSAALVDLRDLIARAEAAEAEVARLRYQMQGKTFVAEQPAPLDRLEAWLADDGRNVYAELHANNDAESGNFGSCALWEDNSGEYIARAHAPTIAAAIEAALKQVEGNNG